MINITVVEKKVEWDAVVASFEHSDFYHTYDYHIIAKNNSDRPILIKYIEEDKIIALPLLIRAIPGSAFKDATSVYGYAGPLSKNIDDNFDNSNFIAKIEGLLLEMEIISVFSRLNPFIPNQNYTLNNLGEVSVLGKIVNIDISQDLDTQKRGYNKRLKSYINKSKTYYTTKLSSTDKEISAFIDLYYENMRRVKASESYFFSRDYFFDFIKSTDFKTEILVAEHKESNKIIAGAMFIKKNNIVQYHLSGASEDYLHLNPIKMIIDEMRIRATKENYKCFNLGGGVGSLEDSLFHFKSSFSKDFKEFAIWKYIVNTPLYNELTIQHLRNKGISHNNCPNSFFPIYRCNINI